MYFKFFTRLFTMSLDFMKLCNVIDIDAMYFYKVSFGKINRLVHKHFSDSCLVWRLSLTCTSFYLFFFICILCIVVSDFCIFVSAFCICFVCSAFVANKRTRICWCAVKKLLAHFWADELDSWTWNSKENIYTQKLTLKLTATNCERALQSGNQQAPVHL